MVVERLFVCGCTNKHITYTCTIPVPSGIYMATSYLPLVGSENTTSITLCYETRPYGQMTLTVKVSKGGDWCECWHEGRKVSWASEMCRISRLLRSKGHERKMSSMKWSKNQGNRQINLHIQCILYIFTNLKSAKHWRFKLYGFIQQKHILLVCDSLDFFAIFWIVTH
jgi:hypothetical protein